MLTPILATDDPYGAAEVFVRAGWTLEFATPKDSGDPLTSVVLHGSSVLLGTSLPEFLPVEARPHRGAGVEFHLTVPASAIDGVHATHAAVAETTPLVEQLWGERAFHVTLCGYRFLIAAGADD